MELFFITAVFMIFTLVKSIFGFGGAVLSLSVLSFSIDIKELILFSLLISIITETFMLKLDWKNFNFKKWLLMITYSLPFSIIGLYFIDFVSSDFLVNVFAIFMLLIALYSFKERKPHPIHRNFLLILSGISQGLFSSGGPLAVVAVKNEFESKSEFRMMMTTYFLTLNIIRFIQLFFIQKTFALDRVISLWWLPIPILIVIFIGNKIHAKVPEKQFKLFISILLTTSALALLLKFY